LHTCRGDLRDGCQFLVVRQPEDESLGREAKPAQRPVICQHPAILGLLPDSGN
jgi:hypothetical protein